MSNSDINLLENPLYNRSMIESFYSRNSIQREQIPRHPVAQMLHDDYKKEEMNKMKKYSELYGTGYAFQLCMERNALASHQRTFPFKSHNLGLNIHCGSYDKIGFNDFLGKDKPFDVDFSLFRQAEKIYLDN